MMCDTLLDCVLSNQFETAKAEVRKLDSNELTLLADSRVDRINNLDHDIDDAYYVHDIIKEVIAERIMSRK